MYLSETDLRQELGEARMELERRDRLDTERADRIRELRDCWDCLADQVGCDHPNLLAECPWCEVERVVQALEL